MSSYVNVGAYVDGHRAKSKKALREALATDPTRVRFDPTSTYGPDVAYQGENLVAALAAPRPMALSVVGPDPYNDRRWYGTIELNAKGEVRVK